MAALAARLRGGLGGGEGVAEAEAESLKEKLDRALEVLEEIEALLTRWAKGGEDGLAQVLRWLQSGDYDSEFRGVNGALSDLMDDLRTDIAVRQLAPTPASALRGGAAGGWAAQDAGDRGADLKALPGGLVASAGGLEELRAMAAAQAGGLERLEGLLKARGVPAAELGAALKRDMASLKRAVSATGDRVEAMEDRIVERIEAAMRGGPAGSRAASGGAAPVAMPRYILRPGAVRVTGELIGRGGYGNVYRGVMNGTTDVAAKVLSMAAPPRYLLKELNREAAVMSELRHPNVVALYGLLVGGERIALVMELCRGGCLADLLADSGRTLDFGQTLRLALGTAAGVGYLHGLESPIVHGDLKAKNVLLSVDHSGQMTPKLCDFGLSKVKKAAGGGGSTSALAGLIMGGGAGGAVGGTLGWAAPELLKEAAYSPEATRETDVYALGVTLWEVFTRQQPYARMADAQVPLSRF